jgi:hypothetical protein
MPELNIQPVVTGIGLFGEQDGRVYNGVVDDDAGLWWLRFHRTCGATGNDTERDQYSDQRFISLMTLHALSTAFHFSSLPCFYPADR